AVPRPRARQPPPGGAVADPLGRRRLAVRPGHGDEVVGKETPGKLQLSHQREPARTRRLHDRRRMRDARTLDDGRDAIEKLDAWVIQVHFDALPRKPAD